MPRQQKKGQGALDQEFALPRNVPLEATRWYQLWLEGDEEAWELLVHTYTPLIFQFCYQFTQRRHLAEEFTQEIFLKLFRNLPHLGHHTNLKLWLLRTAYHYCVDAHRRKVHERRYLRDLWYELREKWRVNQQEREALRQDRRRLIYAAVESLPPDLRGVVILREYLEMSYEQIAETLQIPVGTVKSRLNRARHMLAETLQQVAEQYEQKGTHRLLESLLW